MAQVKLKYTDPVAGASTASLTALAVRGGAFPDEIGFFPETQFEHINGDVTEAFVGFRRTITVDLGVITTLATAKQVLYFLLDKDRKLDLAIATPTGVAQADGGSGSLNGTFYWVVTALDELGETLKSSQVSRSCTNKTVEISWDAMAGATSYRVYRTQTSGSYGATSLLAEVPAYTSLNKYYDSGAVSLSAGSPPTATEFYVALKESRGFATEWLGGVSLGRHYTIVVQERSIRTTFPV
jgi:hypothetical protein